MLENKSVHHGSTVEANHGPSIKIFFEKGGQEEMTP